MSETDKQPMACSSTPPTGFSRRYGVGLGWSGGRLVPNRSLLEIVSVSPRDVKRGDLILFENRRHNVCHRVLWIRREGDRLLLLTKGDGNPYADGWIGAERLLGRVVAVNGRPVGSLKFRCLSFLVTWGAISRLALSRWRRR